MIMSSDMRSVPDLTYYSRHSCGFFVELTVHCSAYLSVFELECDMQDRTEYDDEGSDEITTACTSARRRNGRSDERPPMAHTRGEYETVSGRADSRPNRSMVPSVKQ